MTKYLDLDAVQASVEFTLKLNGKEHPLVEADINTFIANSKDIEKLGVAASTVEEIELTVVMIQRAFPTISEEELRKLKLSQLKAINDFALEANSEKAEKTGEEGEVEGNGEASDK